MWHAWKRREKCKLAGEGCRVDPVGSGYGPVAGSCKYGDAPTVSGATELVS
jgi:hypothetical protein